MSAALSLTASTEPSRAQVAAATANLPIVELCREYRFEAAHQLPKVPAGHRCARVHGHSYKVEIFVRGPVDQETGWLIDFYDLDRAVQPLVDALDHRLLNEIDGLQNPTSEHLCSWLWLRLSLVLPQLDAVTVWETIDSRCTYRGERSGQDDRTLDRARAASGAGHGR